jgi:hypothetical protein
MSDIETKVQYLLDRFEIQDKINLYGLGQDLHQADIENKNILEQWNDLFTKDASIDIKDLGGGVNSLYKYAEIMRGKDLKGGGLEVSFKAWQHIEKLATVEIKGNQARSLSLHFHSHETRDGKQNLIDAGYWHDEWIRTAEGWRIHTRKHQALYTNTYPISPNPHFL